MNPIGFLPTFGEPVSATTHRNPVNPSTYENPVNPSTFGDVIDPTTEHFYPSSVRNDFDFGKKLKQQEKNWENYAFL